MPRVLPAGGSLERGYQGPAAQAGMSVTVKVGKVGELSSEAGSGWVRGGEWPDGKS